jgi:hypothetical protein
MDLENQKIGVLGDCNEERTKKDTELQKSFDRVKNKIVLEFHNKSKENFTCTCGKNCKCGSTNIGCGCPLHCNCRMN